jgi:hypothetical protein
VGWESTTLYIIYKNTMVFPVSAVDFFNDSLLFM